MSQKKKDCARRNTVQSHFFALCPLTCKVSQQAICMEQWFSKCGLQNSITWELLEMQSQTPTRPTNSETLKMGSAICVFTSPPGDSDSCSNLRTAGQEVRLPRKVRTLVAKDYLQKTLGGHLS